MRSLAPGVPRAESRAPALLAALAIHAGVFAVLIYVAKPSFLPQGAAVPINIVANAPRTDSRAAEAAVEAHAAAVETPVARALPPVPARPHPPPEPSPIKPAPAAKPAPSGDHRAARAKSLPAKPAFSLDSLEASIAKAARTAPAKPAFARRGPALAETAPRARVAAGMGVSQSDMQGLQQLLERLWNVNCSVEGADAVTVPVSFTVGSDGWIAGRIAAGGEETSSDPVTYVAARRAIDAVRRAEPYGQVYRGQSFKVIFDAAKACSQP